MSTAGFRVAIVIPCHEDGATLLETVASLEGQESCEVVIVDDGSTDPETLRVLDELKAQGWRVVRQENLGLSAARMRGVAETSAPFVLPLDSDDALCPGGVAPLADALDADPGAALAWGDVEIFGDFELTLSGAPDLDPWHITYVSEVPTSSLIRRDTLLEVGGWEIQGYEDWDLWMLYAEAGIRGVYVPVVAVRHRVHGARMNAGCLDRHGEMLELLRSRHPRLWAERRRNWRRSRRPLRVRTLSPLVGLLPINPRDRHRLFRLVSHPREVLYRRRDRLAAAAARNVATGP